MKLNLKCVSMCRIVCFCKHAFTYMYSLCIISLSLCLSLALLHHIYSFLLPPPLPLDSISPDNEGMIQLSLAHCSDQSASVFLSDCVFVMSG